MPAQRHLRLTQRDQQGILGQVGRRTRPTPPPRLSPMSIHSNSDSSEASNVEPPEVGDLQRMLNLMRNSDELATTINNCNAPNREHFQHLADLNAHYNALQEALLTTRCYVDRVTNYAIFLDRNLGHIADVFKEGRHHLAFMLLHIDPFEPSPIPPPESQSPPSYHALPQPISPIFRPVVDPLEILEQYNSSRTPTPPLLAIPIEPSDHRDYRTLSEQDLTKMGHSGWTAMVLHALLDAEPEPVDVFRFNRIRRELAEEAHLGEWD